MADFQRCGPGSRALSYPICMLEATKPCCFLSMPIGGYLKSSLPTPHLTRTSAA